jgi:hypothetical protein
MSATSIYFNGRMTRIPGSYSEIDTSGLEAVGLGASGYVAVVGTAVGGKPYSAIDPNNVSTDIQASTRPGKAKTYFKSGDLLEAEALVFGPSNDADIPAGAQRVYWVKVNNASQSTATFNNSDGPALVLTSADYGHHTTKINVQIASGTVTGKKVIIAYDTTTETLDNLGYSLFTLTYLSATPANGFSTITLQVTATKLEAAFTRTAVGLDSDITNPVAPGGYAGVAIELLSSNPADTQIVTIYGVDDAGLAACEAVTLTGSTMVTTATLWSAVHGARISAAPTGTVTVRNPSAGTTILTLDSGNLTRGLRTCTTMPMAGTALTLVCDAASTAKLTIAGKSATGADQYETLTLNGTTPVVGTATWSQLSYFAVGGVAAARTVTASGVAVNAPYATYGTLQECADLFNGMAGFTFTSVTGIRKGFTITSGQTAFDMTGMDIYAATNIKSPATGTFGADLQAMIDGINAKSALVTAARGTPGTGAPTNTAVAVFLAGGNEGSATPGQEGTPYATAADWQAALDVLKNLFVNTIGVMTHDPAVHAMLKEHCTYMCGAGRMERDGVVGLQNAGMTGNATKAEIKTQIINLNDRNIRAVAQQCERYTTDGVKTTLDPKYTACLIAGMQAGASVGTPLTHKVVNTLAIYNSTTWHPRDDADEMIEAGLLFLETVDGIGRRVVRNVTTHVSTSNIAYTEGSVNQAANYAAYNFRSQLETIVGQKGFSGTVQAAIGVGKNILDKLMEDVLVTWRSLDADLTLDVLEVTVEMAPVLPINFVKNVIHLIAVPQSAAA